MPSMSHQTPEEGTRSTRPHTKLSLERIDEERWPAISFQWIGSRTVLLFRLPLVQECHCLGGHCSKHLLSTYEFCLVWNTKLLPHCHQSWILPFLSEWSKHSSIEEIASVDAKIIYLWNMWISTSRTWARPNSYVLICYAICRWIIWFCFILFRRHTWSDKTKMEGPWCATRCRQGNKRFYAVDESWHAIFKDSSNRKKDEKIQRSNWDRFRDLDSFPLFDAPSTTNCKEFNSLQIEIGQREENWFKKAWNLMPLSLKILVLRRSINRILFRALKWSYEAMRVAFAITYPTFAPNWAKMTHASLSAAKKTKSWEP